MQKYVFLRFSLLIARKKCAHERTKKKPFIYKCTWNHYGSFILLYGSFTENNFFIVRCLDK